MIAHPAYILRGQWAQARYQIGYLGRVREILAGTYVAVDVTLPPPGARLNPAAQEIAEWLAGCRGASLDIEFCGPALTIIGVWDKADRSRGGITVRIRGMRGVPHPWTWAEWRIVVRAMYTFLADASIPKGAHNGQACDVWYLERFGFRVEGYAWDTILMLHMADPERPKDLQTASVALVGRPHWKHLVKDEDRGEGK